MKEKDEFMGFLENVEFGEIYDLFYKSHMFYWDLCWVFGTKLELIINIF